MFKASHKANQYLLAALKVLVLVVTFGYIFFKIQNSESLGFTEFAANLTQNGKTSGYVILLFLLLASANWLFEILKWKTVISAIEKIDFKTAAKQSLASLTISLATPNRIGDYGAKAYFYESSKRKKILLLNFYSNGVQMLVTTLFGIFGIVYFISRFTIGFSVKNIIIIGVSIITLMGLGYFIKEKDLLLKGFSIAKVIKYFRSLSASIKLKTFLFSIIRYLIFSGMFYGLLQFFGSEINFIEAFALIFAMYLLVSLVPTLFIFDVVVRGGVAVWLFSYAGVPEIPVLCTVFAMWLLNFVLPSLWGSVYVLTYQPTTR